MKLLGRTWKYISEGNVHIVLQLEETNYVLRLIKEDNKPMHKEDLRDSLNFVNLIMVPLLENHFYGTGEIVEIPVNTLPELARNLQQYRPKTRLNKVLLSQFAVKTVNLAIVSFKCKSPTFCVEIKPKEGFISSSLKMHSRCYYCLKQYLKMCNKEIQKTSAYCPLDLFSGNKIRMKNSIANLSMHPQNNFRIFKNGMILYHDKSVERLDHIIKSYTPFKNTTLLADFIVEVLLKERYMPADINSCQSEIVSKESEISSPETEMLSHASELLSSDLEARSACNESTNLKPGCLLDNLLFLQKLSETETVNNIDASEKAYEYVRTLLDKIEAMKLDLKNEKDRKTFLTASSPVHLSMISAIAKDCSIMISFTTEYVEEMPYIDVQDCSDIIRIYYKVALTDLEPKPITTLLKRKHTEQRIVETYTKHLQSENINSQ